MKGSSPHRDSDNLVPGSLWANGAWEALPIGTWVEIQNGRDSFSGNRGTISYGPYGSGNQYDPTHHNTEQHLPPMYNILVTKPYQKAVEVNFFAHNLRKLSLKESNTG